MVLFTSAFLNNFINIITHGGRGGGDVHRNYLNEKECMLEMELLHKS